MSSKLLVDIWHCGYGDASMILVLMALADEANDKGEWSADIKAIAGKARQSVRNCRYLLRKLEDLDIIERFEARGRKHTNSYRIRIENLQNLQPLPVSENLQKVQPLPVIKPAKGANDAMVAGLQPGKPATIAADAPPFPPDPLSPEIQDKPQTQEETHTPSPLPLGEGTSIGHTEKQQVQAKPKKAQKQPNTFYSPGFERMWVVLPPGRKIGKVETFTIWRERGLETRTDEIIEKLERLKITTWFNKELRWIPMPETWFSKARYEDELVPLGIRDERGSSPANGHMTRNEQRQASTIANAQIAMERSRAREDAAAGHGTFLQLPSRHEYPLQ